MEWLKRRLRGTLLHRLLRRGAEQRSSGPETAVADQSAAYDRQTVEVMRRLLHPDSSCIDLGAHRGAILQHMVAIAPAGTHHAFEPIPHLAAELRQRFPRVRVHQVAVADSAGQTDFQYVENAPAYSGLRRRLYDRPDPIVITMSVTAVALDDVIPADQAIAFMKIDIEGGEYHALKGAVNTIRRSRPAIVFEASSRSTGQYGVTATDMYDLITQTFEYQVSTMSRWLNQLDPFALREFCSNWDKGPEYYFIATPVSMRA